MLPDGRRVGELDEEMVYEARPGQTFLLGASIVADRGDRPRPRHRHARARASRAPCRSGAATPSGGPKELGEAIGAFSRWAVDQTAEALGRDYDLDPLAARNLLDFLREQQDATRVVPERPHDRRRALPRRDRRLAPVRPLARSAAASTPPGRWR